MHYFFRFSNADRFSLPPNTGYIRCNCDVGVPENSRRFEPCPRRIRCGKIWVQTYDEMFMPKQQKKQLEAEMDESMIGSQVSGGEELLGDELGDEEQSITSSLISMKKREKDAKKAREIKARLDSNAEAVGGLEKFEQTLLGAELLKAKKAVQPEELSMSMKSRKPEPYSYEVTSKMNQDEFFNATKRLTGNPKRWKIQYTKAINMVKESAERKARLREQRERRRRKFLADSQL